MHLARRSICIPKSINNGAFASVFYAFDGIHRSMTTTNYSQSANSTSNENILPFKQIPGSGLIQSLYSFLLKDGFSRIHLLEQESRNKYGVLFRQNFGPFNAVYVCEPDLVQQVYKMEGKYPKRDQELPQWEKYHKDRKRTTRGIFMSEGKDWYISRSALSPKMLKTKEVAEYIPVLLQVADDLIARLKELKATTSDQTVPKIQNELFKWSLESVGSVMLEKRFGLFDTPPSKEAQQFIESAHKIFDGLLNSMFYPPWLIDYYKSKAVRDFYEGMDVVYDFAELAVHDKLQQIQQGNINKDGKVDFLTFLVQNKKLPMDKIVQNFVEILFAAVDTTSNTTLWTLYNLSRHPDTQDMVHKEVVSLLKTGQVLTPSVINKMHYLRACIKETLRLYPGTVENTRIFDRDVTLHGYNIPKETLVMIPLYTMGRDPAIFDDPLQFKPERWLRDGDSNQYHAFSLLPFGHGVRMCIGRRIAMLEITLLVSKLVHEFHVESLNEVGTKVRGLLMPDHDVLLKLNERKS